MKNGGSDTQVLNMIAHGTRIKGDIESEGDFRIEGSLIGTVKSKGKIVIGESGSVEGQVYCQNADISGKIKGKIEVKELTVLKESSTLEGDIATKKISIEPGAVFTGSCQMSATTVGAASKSNT